MLIQKSQMFFWARVGIGPYLYLQFWLQITAIDKFCSTAEKI